MSTTSPMTPQKHCLRCGAVNQTTAKKCPSCGKSYKRRTFLKVFVGLCLLGLISIVGCGLLIAGGATEVAKQLDAQQKEHAITRHQFRAIDLGMTEAQVVRTVGKRPENRQEFHSKSFLSEEPSNSSCIYYNRADGSFGDVFQLCFDAGRLTSKNAY